MFALFAAGAGASTIVQTTRVQLDPDFLEPDHLIKGVWDFDPFAPAGGGTLTGALLQTNLNLSIQTPAGNFTSWGTHFVMGTNPGFYTTQVFGLTFIGSTLDTTSLNYSFTPSQLANFLDPAQTQMTILSNIADLDSTRIRGNVDFVLTYEYETAAISVPDAGSSLWLLSGTLAALATLARYRHATLAR